MPNRKKPDFTKFSPQQLHAARMLSDPEFDHSNREIAKAVGVTERTFYRWREDEDFLELCTYLHERAMDAFAGDVYRALRRKVIKGDTKAIELALKRMGVLIDRKEIQSDVKVEHEVLAGKSNEVLLAEIQAKETALLDTTETSPDTFEVSEVTDVEGDPFDDAPVAESDAE